MNDEPKGMMCAYRAVFTQTNVAGGTIKVSVTAKEEMVVLYGRVGPNNYAAGRSLLALVTDSAGNTIARVLYSSSVDNVSLPFPWLSSAAMNSEATNNLTYKLILGVGDVLVIYGMSLVQDETLTIVFRSRIKASLPTVVTTGSGGTVTTVTTYNKVI